MKLLTLIFLIGSFSALSMAPYSLPPTLFIGLSALYIILTSAPSPLKSGIIGFLFSLGYFSFSLSWVGNALLIEDNPYWWAYPLAVLGLPIILSLFTAVSCYLYKITCKTRNDIYSFIAFIILISASEYARGHLFTGFPWNLYGYSWIETLPIAQIASISDIYLLSTITILWCASPAFILSCTHSNITKIILSGIIALSFISAYIWGSIRINDYQQTYHSDYELVIIQPNIKQSQKWLSEKIAPHFIKQIRLSTYNPNKNSSDKKAYYIIWPETAINQQLLNSDWANNLIKDMLKSYPNNAYLITGALRYDKQSKNYFNSVITIDNNANITNTYNKSHLVPFGEYMPLSNIFDIAPIVGFTGFVNGTGQQSITMPEGLSFSPLICYEIIFSGKSYDYGATKPDFIINLTNDAWYGISAGPYQHLVQAKFRAIETGIPVIRSANTGVSSVISPIGISLNRDLLSAEQVIISQIPHPLQQVKYK